MRLNLSQKTEILAKLGRGISGKHLAKEYNVAESTITRIKHDKDKGKIVFRDGRNCFKGSISKSLTLDKNTNLDSITEISGWDLARCDEESNITNSVADFELEPCADDSKKCDHDDRSIESATGISSNSSQLTHLADDEYSGGEHLDVARNEWGSSGADCLDYDDDDDTRASGITTDTRGNESASDVQSTIGSTISDDVSVANFNDYSSDSNMFTDEGVDPNELCEKLRYAIFLEQQKNSFIKIISELRYGGFIE